MAQMDMNAWVRDVIAAKRKKAAPILSFPCISILDTDVKTLVNDAALMADGILTIAKRVPTALAMSMMDLSVEAERFGSPVEFYKQEAPAVTDAIVHDITEAEALETPTVYAGRTAVCLDAIERVVRAGLDVPVFAGAIGPFSLAGRLRGITEIMMDCYLDTELVHAILKRATAFVIDYIAALKAVGANGVILAEPLTGMLPPQCAEEFSEPYVKQLIDAVQDERFCVIYHNCGPVVPMLDSIFRLGAKGYHFGNAVDMREVLPKAPHDVLILGNVDPASRFYSGTPESIRENTRALLESCGGYPNFVISSGCDIPPATDWQNIDAFFETVEAFYQDK